MPAIDQSSDTSGRELYRIAQLYAPPDFVKSASSTALGRTDLPAHLYADPVGRRFPIDSPESTWTSYVFFAEKKAEIIPVRARQIESRLEAAVTGHGIRPEIDALQLKLAASLQPEDDSDDFAWQGSGDSRLPVRNALEAKKACEWLHRHRAAFEFPERSGIARRILTKAAAFGADLGDEASSLAAMAALGTCARATAAEFLNGRADLIGQARPDLAGELRKIASNLKPAISPARLEKIASLVEQVDKATGVYRLYSPTIRRAEDALFTVTKSSAAQFLDQHIDTVTGSVFRRDDLLKIKVADLRDRLGDDLADSMTTDGVYLDGAKLAAIVPTLPRPDARALEHLAADHGITPATKTAAAAQRDRLDSAAITGLAASFVAPQPLTDF
jgi:hypothetical protein